MTEKSPIGLSKELSDKVLSFGASVTKDDVDVYARIHEVENKSYKLRRVLAAWEHQHSEERALRKTYAKWLLVILSVQALLINVAFFLIGFGWLVVEQWVATSFIVAVYGEVAAMTLIVVKYLFPDVRPDVLNLIEDL